MPCGATGVLLRIGTSCCADNGTAKMARAVAESNQWNPFIASSPGSMDTGLSIVLRRARRAAPLLNISRPVAVDKPDGTPHDRARSCRVHPACHGQHGPGPDPSAVRGGIGAALSRVGYPHGGVGAADHVIAGAHRVAADEGLSRDCVQ